MPLPFARPFERLRSLATRARDRPQAIASGLGVGMKLDASPSAQPYAAGSLELPVQKAIARHLRLGQVFYDIGANEGFFTLIGARFTGPEGAVFAFEPEPGNAGRIRINLSHNDLTWASVIESAVSDRAGRAELLLTRHGGGHTLASAGADTPPDVRGRMTVATTTIDRFVAMEGGHRPPDLVKIDVEGVEPAVLAGMRTTLASARPTVIYELDAPDTRRLEAKRHEVHALLTKLGYIIEQLPPSYDGPWLVVHEIAKPRREGT